MTKRNRMAAPHQNRGLSPCNRCRGVNCIAALLTITASAWASGACASDATVIGHDDSGVRSGDSGDAGQGAATVSVYEAYGFCSPNLMGLPCEEFQGNGVGQFTVALEDCFCFRDCDKDADCPVPSDGTAEPVCVGVEGDNSCVLSCGDGRTCPKGMTCRAGFQASAVSVDASPVCTWYTPPEESVRDNPDACSAYTSKEQCEGAFSDYPTPPTYTCAWASVGTYARGVAGCEPVATAERCMRVRVDDPASGGGAGCDPAHTCAGEMRPVYWQELAGDITLVKVNGCGSPLNGAGNAELRLCEFGVPSTPTVCDCACGS
jgi:hypothetical protein